MSQQTEDLRIQLEKEILTGKLSPGTRLDEVSLAERFGVSRTPIRETLFQLAASGLIERQPRKGNFVAEITPMSLVEMFDVLAELEGMSARLAARRGSDEDLARIKTALDECRKIIDDNESPDQYHFKNEEFHRAIHRAGHNAFLITQIEQLHKRLRAYRRLQLHPRGRISRSLEEHTDIYLAIEKGDTIKADELMRAHIVVSGEGFVDLLASISKEND